MVVSMTSHNQLSHVVPHFNHPDLMNAVVLFMAPSVSCEADAGANGVTLHFHHLDHDEHWCY